jgi:hypothetical protein
MIDRSNDKIDLDIDKGRIREIVEEALRMIYKYVGGEYTLSRQDVLKELELFLNNGQISTQFFLKIGSKKIPDLLLRVDPRRRKVLGISGLKKRAAKINIFLRILG